MSALALSVTCPCASGRSPSPWPRTQAVPRSSGLRARDRKFEHRGKFHWISKRHEPNTIISVGLSENVYTPGTPTRNDRTNTEFSTAYCEAYYRVIGFVCPARQPVFSRLSYLSDSECFYSRKFKQKMKKFTVTMCATCHNLIVGSNKFKILRICILK